METDDRPEFALRMDTYGAKSTSTDSQPDSNRLGDHGLTGAGVLCSLAVLAQFTSMLLSPMMLSSAARSRFSQQLC